MLYNNVIFDFDSTLIRFESLELIMKNLLNGDENKIKAIEGLTEAGMNGEISFRESLDRRLQIAKPTKAALNWFAAQYCPSAFTFGIEALIIDLQRMGVEVFIISGGFKELILPFSQTLHINQNYVFAVELNWDEQGVFKSLNNDNGFCDSKLVGAQKIKHKLKGKTVVIGDGFTDFELYRARIADDFIVYTEHVKRRKVINLAPYYANSTEELRVLLQL